MAIKSALRSVGQVALCRNGRTHAELAAFLGVSPSIIVFWRSGERKPAWASRIVLEEKLGIPQPAWDEPSSSSELPDPKREREPMRDPVVVSQETVSERAARMDAMVHELLNDFVAESEPMAKAKIMTACANILTMLGRLTGEMSEISEARIVKHRAFRKIMDTIEKTLEPWPEALEAVGAALKDLE